MPHGWLSAFSTAMNARAERAHPGADRLLIERLIIDLMLAHVPTGMSETEFRYNRNRYMERRRELSDEWGTLLMKRGRPGGGGAGGQAEAAGQATSAAHTRASQVVWTRRRQARYPPGSANHRSSSLSR